MNKSNRNFLIIGLLMIGLTGFGINQLRVHQRLGAPGIKTEPIAGSKRLKIVLPAHVLDYAGEPLKADESLLSGLPQDTSFIQQRYSAGTNDSMLYNVVLMGTDRTSIHKPQYCLTGSGWAIDANASTEETIRIQNPHPYDLPVMKMWTSRTVKSGDREIPIKGLYIYWFVADHQLTASHVARMMSSTTRLIEHGELVRWAYVGCFAACFPGDEAVTYERMKRFISASVPDFQLATGPMVDEKHATSGTPVATASLR